MSPRTAITVQRSREDVQRLWSSSEHPHELEDAAVTFKNATGDRGTEIHVDLHRSGRLGGVKLAKVKDELRRFKQRVETGEIARSDAVPEGHSARGRRLKQRPARPLDREEAVAR